MVGRDEKRQFVPFNETEYLALEAVASFKHEFVRGRILGMAGAEMGHGVISFNIGNQLATAMGERRCRVVLSDLRVKVEKTREYFYPDVTLVCAQPKLVEPAPRSLVNPEVIFEVSSPSTASYDARTKWVSYQQIPSLTDYVIVDGRTHTVHHRQRAAQGWTHQTWTEADVLELANGMRLEVGAFFRLLDL